MFPTIDKQRTGYCSANYLHHLRQIIYIRFLGSLQAMSNCLQRFCILYAVNCLTTLGRSCWDGRVDINSGGIEKIRLNF